MKNHNAEGPHQDDDPNTHDADYQIDEEDILPEEDDPPMWVDSSGRTLDEAYEEEDDDPPGETKAQRNTRLRALEKVRFEQKLLEDKSKNMTPAQQRTCFLQDCATGHIPSVARQNIYHDIIEKCRESNVQFDKYLAPPITRPADTGFYIGTYEAWRMRYYDSWWGADKSHDSEILDHLLTEQPHRIPCAVTGDLLPTVPTYGPLMLPESADPITAAPAQPDPEIRPAQWAPDASASEITAGVAREMLDCVALYVARIKVATGHRPDDDAITQLHKLSHVLKNAQRIADKASRKPRNYRTGRPRKKRLPESIKVTTLKIEMAEKHQKHTSQKKARITKTESTSEPLKSPETENAP